MSSINSTQETLEPPVRPEKGHRWFASRYDSMNRSMEKGFLSAMRREHLAGLTGDVLEIGAGTGANFRHYPPQVRVAALEPDPFMLERAKAKLWDLGRTNITLQLAPAESLPFPDASFDNVVSTLVLCTVKDVRRSVDEMHRVLRPGGKVFFIEHVRAAGVFGGLQDVLRPIWGYFGAGCRPNRRTEESFRDAGWDVVIEEQRRVMGFMPMLRGNAKRLGS